MSNAYASSRSPHNAAPIRENNNKRDYLAPPPATTRPLTPPDSDTSLSPRINKSGLPPVSPKRNKQRPLPAGVAFPANGDEQYTPPDPDISPRQRFRSTVSVGQPSPSQSLRKKIENELSRKRPGGGRGPSEPQHRQESSYLKRPSRRHQKGTVAGLRPSPALTVPEGMSIADASQLCAAKRTDCVLVVDDEEGLSGIFTAKDLAFRVTADGLDPRTTTVAQIMTRNPMVTRDSTSATEALQVMVSRHFRHLPVCNDDGDVVGLLDITKVFHDALAKVERSSSATSQLSMALAGVQTELGPNLTANPQAAAMMAYVDALRDRMAQPDLTSVLDTSLPPPTVTPRTSVREAARLMKERRTTAVCVLEPNGTSVLSGVSNSGVPPKIAGIFTSKDIVLRVIAAGLDSSRCSVVRVMTPHPDTAPPDMTVQDALKKMHTGHYLNLPVVEADGRLLGIVDVLKLTYATLEQIDTMNDDRSDAGPMWSKFFDTLNTAGGDDESHSAISGAIPDTPSKVGHQRALSNATSPMSEVMPGDSASVVNETNNDAISDIGTKAGATSSLAPALPVDDGTYIFKFKTPSGRVHRFQARHDSYDLLRDIIHGKLQSDPFFDAPADPSRPQADSAVFTIAYTDDEGDLVQITADGDVLDAVNTARGQKTDRVTLLINGGRNWEDAARSAGGEDAVEKLKVAETVPPEQGESHLLDPEEADPAHAPAYGAKGVHARSAPAADDLIAGVLPKDLALPAAIGFLGVVILGVFIASRKSN